MQIATKQIASSEEEQLFFKEVAGETFSANYVIHAYERGVEKGKTDQLMELKTTARNLFIKNRDYVVETAFNLVAEMIADGIDMKRGWIRSEITNDFDIVIAVPESHYYSPSTLKKFYVKVNDLEILSNSLDMHLNIWFINNDKSINEERLYDDGFDLNFDIQTIGKILTK